ncbi:LuxR C-terminal-related transcriptional regulator [Chitinophaga sp. CC14]|uniref:LuxR C-terminal-related transcriptional regulator n=1 Tax=Chitinophaga sp. CC14 TaxID=3029199 RepID=UPI003B77FCFB
MRFFIIFTIKKMHPDKLAFGSYSKGFITDVPADLTSPEALHFKNTIRRFADEAIYIYSFKENKMLYADGWEELLGYADNEISMLTIVNITAPEYAPFSNELNDKALMFLHNKFIGDEPYSFTIELKKIHKNGTPVPLISKVGVFTTEQGKVTSIIGHSQKNESIKFGNVMRYAAYGPEKSEFEEELNKQLFRYYAISEKEKDALSLVAEGYSFKEIAARFGVSQSAIEKRILPMYKRFGVKSLTHLISFAFANHILP